MDTEDPIGDDFFQSSDHGGDTAPPRDEPDALPVPPRLGLLANLTVDEFTEVARSAQLKHLEPERTVFRQGEQADRFFILIDGRVRVCRDGEVIATLGPGSFFGEGALFTGGKRSATIETVEASSLWSVDYGAFDEIVSHQLMADETAREEVHARIRATPPGAAD